MRKRKIILSMAAIGAALSLSGCQVKGVTADEWLTTQYADVPKIKYFCADLDDIFSSYITGAMSQEDFRDEIEMAAMIYNQMLAERQQQDIRPGTYTEVSKTAHDGYEQMWVDLGNMLTAFLNADDSTVSDKNQVAYLYMAYGDSMKEDMDDYYAGYTAAGGVSQ